MAEEIIRPWVNNTDGRFLGLDVKKGCCSAVCCYNGEDDEQAYYNSNEG